MGVLHEEGAHVPKSKYMAGNYYKKASEMGQTDAKVNLAVMLMDDFAESENNETVVKEMTMTGDGPLNLNVNKKLIPQTKMYHLRNNEEPEEMLIEAANKGNSRAQELLKSFQIPNVSHKMISYIKSNVHGGYFYFFFVNLK
jgi:TPR repeat protein